MKKHAYIRPVGLTLSLLMAGWVQAQPAAPTLPVLGKGAPAAPTSVTVAPALQVGTASTATVSGYSDPDNDPFASWQYEWRSGANGTGSLLGSGVNYTPSNTNPIYVRSRAQASRGFPVEQQTGAWQEVVFTPVAAGPDLSAGCTQGTVTSGGLTYTCPLTKGVADTNGVAYTSTYTENGAYGPAGKTYILQTWSQANTYCTNLGNGYRLASQSELSALYSAKGNMYTAAGWPTSSNYWSSTNSSAGSHYVVRLYNGNVSDGGVSGFTYVSCVRSGS